MNTISSLFSRIKPPKGTVGSLLIAPLLFVVAAAFLFAPVANAQNDTSGGTWTMPSDEQLIKSCTYDGALGSIPIVGGAANAVGESMCKKAVECIKAQNPKNQQEFAAASQKCSQEIASKPIESAVEATTDAATQGLKDIGLDILIAVAYFIFTLSNFMLGIAGTLFNWVLLVTVYQFGTYFGNSQAILLAWGILRDLANIVLLFGFIFMGLQTILDIGHFNVKKALPRLLIFAILMNFSLFVTEAIIDTTNVFSAVMSTQAGTGCDPKAAQANEQCVQYGIAGKIMQGTGLSGIFNTKNSYGPSAFSDKTVAATVYVGAALLSAIGAMVLFMGAILLIIRAVTLVFLMVLSPLGFAAFAVPQFEETARTWWKTLLNQAITAPVFILLILVSLKIAEQFQIQGGSGTQGLIAAFVAQNTSSLGVFLVYTLVIGFLVASMIVTKKIGSMGASFATNMAGRAVGAGTFGVAGFVGRRTIGAAGMGAASAIRSSKFGRTGMGRLLATGADKVSGFSFDARNAAGKTLGKTGIDFGKATGAASHGIHGIEEEEVKKRKEYAKKLKQTAEEQSTQKGAAEAVKASDEVSKRLADEKKAAAKQSAADIRTQQEANFAELAPQRQALKDAKEELDRARQSGDETRIKAAEQAYANDMEAYKLREKELQQRVDSLQAERSEREARFDQQIAEQKEIKAKYEGIGKAAGNAPQEQYAKNMEKKRWYGYVPGSIGEHADHEAAKAILAELKKSKTEKKLDELIAAQKEGNKTSHDDAKEHIENLEKESHGDHGGGDDHKPH